jgi:nucleoside-diphosphate-sugar epimerase
MIHANKVTVTGGNGFVGQALCKYLCNINYDVIGTVRDDSRSISDYKCVSLGGIDSDTDWSPALRGRNTVVHLAGRAHVLRDQFNSPINEFRRVNT